eukprot:jgi/Mesen1/8526/ME000480S07875
MRKNVQDLPGSLQKTATALPSRRAVAYFGAMLAAGAFFVFVAFAMFLPVMVVYPQKFALCFTIGCILIMGAFFVLKGPAQQLQHMTSMEVLALAYYVISYFPGGSTGMRFLTSMGSSAVWSLVGR